LNAVERHASPISEKAREDKHPSEDQNEFGCTDVRITSIIDGYCAAIAEVRKLDSATPMHVFPSLASRS
jgi:hypothetical protein